VSVPAPLSDLPLRLCGVTVRIGQTTALSDVSVTFDLGAPTAVIGPNGAGKTTLLRVAMGLLAPSVGAVTWGGRDESDVGRRALVFQRPVMLRRSVVGNIRFALAGQGLNRTEERARIEHALAQAALSLLADRPARTLSGGEQQRLALARALVRRPELLLLDEPGNNLDPAAMRAVEAMISQAAAAGTKIVMVTHDLGQARRLAGDVVFLSSGRILERATAEQFFRTPSSEQGRAFLRGDIVGAEP
jgi:tungstate transport system ATP-binding protein